MRMEIRGDIVGNDDKWIYEWLGWEATCPADLDRAIAKMQTGETLEVHINSGGGSVFAGQEIYTKLKTRTDVTIEIQSLAGSAAGVIAMAGRSRISPVGMIMIHNVAMSGASGDYHDMQKNAEILKQMNEAMASAYVAKSGRPLDEIMKLMDRETWLTANQCVKYGFVDEIINESATLTNACGGMRLTDEIRQRVRAEREQKERDTALKDELLEDLDMYGA